MSAYMTHQMPTALCAMHSMLWRMLGHVIKTSSLSLELRKGTSMHGMAKRARYRRNSGKKRF